MSRRRLSWTSPVAGVTAGLALIAALAALPSSTAAREPAFHLRLLRADPPVDSTVAASPAAIRLWFSETVKLKPSSVTVTNSSGAKVALGALTLDTAAKAPIVAKVMAPMAPGKYTVAWRTMGRDSHIVKGTFAFTVAAPKNAAGHSGH